MKTPEQIFKKLGNRGEYAALPSITVEEIAAIQSDARAELEASFAAMREALDNALKDRANTGHVTLSAIGKLLSSTDAGKSLLDRLQKAEAERDSFAARALTAELRLAWLDLHCSFVADYEYNLGPFKRGELDKLADAGIEADKQKPRQALQPAKERYAGVAEQIQNSVNEAAREIVKDAQRSNENTDA